MIRLNTFIWIAGYGLFLFVDEVLGRSMEAFVAAVLCLLLGILINVIQAIYNHGLIPWKVIGLWIGMIAIGGVIAIALKDGIMNRHKGYMGLGSHGIEYILFGLMGFICPIFMLLFNVIKNLCMRLRGKGRY